MYVRIQVADTTEVSGETVSADIANQVDRNAVLISKKVSKKSLSKKLKRSKRKAKATSVETEKDIGEDDNTVDKDACLKSAKDQCSSDVTSDILPKPAAELNVSDDEEPPEDFSFGDARQQTLEEEEHVKQYLAKCVYN